MFEKIKQAISLPALCAKLGIEIAGGKGLCPLHADENPSFFIYPDEHFYCFGCGAYGDVIDLARLTQNFSYSRDAALWLASEFSIELPQGTAQARPRADVLSETLFYYRQSFWRNLAQFVSYIYCRRHLTVKLFADAQVGWADGGLAAHLTERGFAQKDIAAAGLIKKSGKDFFSGGFIFPIFLRPGEVGTLRFRSLDKRIYQLPHKTQTEGAYFFGQELLFGELPLVLHLCEGEFDALALRFWGLSALATCGTPRAEALTWLKERFTGEIRLVPDNKEGEKWLRVCCECLPQAKIIQYPAQFADYDDYLKPHRSLITSRGGLSVQKSAEGAALIAGPQLKSSDTAIVNRAELGISIEVGERAYFRVRETPVGIEKTAISNFRLHIREIITRAKECLRLIEIRNSGCCVRELTGNDIMNIANVTNFLFGCGTFSFWGNHSEWKEILRYEEHQAGIVNTVELNCFGRSGDLWAFSESLFRNGSWFPRDSTGKYFVSDVEAYRVADSRVAPPRLSAPPSDWRNLEQKLLELLHENIGVNAWLALGWARACFFVDEVFKQHGAFPILYLAGKTQAGKTVLARWLSALWGLQQLEAISFRGTTYASLVDYLSLSSEVPVWISEFSREDERAEILKSLYDRTGISKKIKEGGKWVAHYYPFRACAIVEGARAPEKIEIVNRLIILSLSQHHRQDNLFEPLERMSAEFWKVGAGWLSERAAMKARFAERLIFWRMELLKVFAGKHISASRLAQNYSVVLSGLELMLAPEKFSQFADFVKRICVEHEEVESRHSVIQEFIEELQYLHNTQPEKLQKMIRATPKYTTLWTGGIVRLIKDTRREPCDFTAESLNKYFSEEPYYERLGGVQFRRTEKSHHCLVLWTAKLPPALQDIVGNIEPSLQADFQETVFGD